MGFGLGLSANPYRLAEKFIYRFFLWFVMDSNERTELLYLFHLKFIENPRIKYSQLHRLQTFYKAENSTIELIHAAFNRKIILSPILYCNSGIDVELRLKDEIEDQIGHLESLRNNPDVTRAVALFGEHSFLCFRKGASILKYAEAVKPTMNSSFKIKDLELKQKGKLPSDPYPRGWDELDWKIYDLMRDPRIPFPKISGHLQAEDEFSVSWKTVSAHYEKIVKDCKSWVGFFPRGMDNYSQTFLTFRTDYEKDLRNELQKLDRSTYIYKMGKMIILNLFLDNNIDHRVFVELKKKGLIHDLRVSMPVHFWTPLPI